MKRDTPAERAMRRRLALLALLHKRPHRYEEIIATLDTQNLLVYDRMENARSIVQQQRYQFRHDIQALRLLYCKIIFFFFNDTATTEIYTLSLHDALPI